MSVGNELIDYGHRHLIGYINTIELLLISADDKELITEALEQLHEATIRNFRIEESIQRKIGFPQTLQHRREHKKLLDQLEEVMNNIERCKTSHELSEYAPELINFLRNWIVDHVFHEDMLLRPFLSKYPKSYS